MTIAQTTADVRCWRVRLADAWARVRPASAMLVGDLSIDAGLLTLLMLLVGGAMLPRRATAQSLRGQVVLADSVTPVAGVIVSIESPSGVVVARALSDERGTFTIRAGTSGVFRLRALRIGYQPTLVERVVVDSTGARGAADAAANMGVRVVLTSVPVTLPKVAVRSEAVCLGGSGDGAVVAAVWEEARKALLASGLTSSAPLMAEWIEYERTLDTTGRYVRDQHVKSTRTATTHAFRSRPAAVLADSGYVIDEADGSRFHAPDAEVLLSESFAAQHCFHVEPPVKGREQLIGVGFAPARERPRVSDIAGTFWIDRASSELRSLEYRYTNLPPITERASPGGTVEFQRLPSGSWLVNRWQIRMPQLVVTAPTTVGRRNVLVSTGGRAVTAVRIVGGEVSSVQRNDSTIFHARGATLALEVTSNDSLVSPADSRISVDGTDYELTTDRRGRASIALVLPGQYRARVQTPLMDSLGVAGETVDVTVRESEAREQRIPLPSSADLLKRVCGDNATPVAGAHLRGVVVDSVGLPVANAEIRLRWQQQIAIVRDRLAWNERFVTTTSDSLGLWQFCAVPRDASIQIAATSAEGTGRSRTRIGDSVLFASARVQVRPEAITAGVVPSTEATLGVSVTDGAQRPLKDVQILVNGSVGAPHRLRTDSAGRAALTRLPAGVYGIEVRKVGYASGTLSVDVEPGENTVPLILEKSSIPQLATMRVVGDRPVVARHADFERRRAAGEPNAVITEEEIDKRNPPHAWQLLTRVPGLLVLDSLGFVYARASRMSVYKCWPRVAIDGKILMGRPNLAVELPPSTEIYGIEVYSGSARLPIDVAGEGDQRFCGLIAVWTK